MTETVDAVVVGLGPGGETLAGELAEAGLEVVGVESHLVGGECPYYGCIPSKMLIRAADSLAEARRVPRLAGTSTVSPDFPQVAERIRTEATTDWDDEAAARRFTDKGGRLVRGRARISGPRSVHVDGQEFTAKRALVLNPGTEPAVPPVPGLADTPYWTNREALRAVRAPRSLAVLGGGAIGLELAQGYARFGTEVLVVEAAETLLPAEEPAAGRLLAEVLREEGLTVRTGASLRGVRHQDGAFTLELDEGAHTVERLLVSTGRRTDLRALGVAELGLDPDARGLEPDGQLRIAPGVWAIGDVTGKGAFTHISTYQAAIATRAILGQPGPDAEYHAVPRVTFTDPEVGAVGLTEAQARDRGMSVRTGMAELPESPRGWIHGAGNAGFVKLVADRDTDTLVGATSAGPSGGEMLSGLTVAVHAGTPISRLRRMILAYPTFHRVMETALDQLD
ncbi:dihydrolipoyl dehydrogenase family protein [Streptomyces oceani]|uniref:Pyridine nucleotide-disulfide oxidoreductase n=1 Tax=Streptomyces oceani TaxID=1075402 RepID=A0A1E7KG30_9ACTN|nr:NAD(P)/FAD-dependent oxidoreductase [Streptomyces oceani]OEV02892.1 pyridine nucleotide-disulfide oxidoreductase [Streptomyces oceani]